MNKKEIISILTVNQRVAGSSPALGASILKGFSFLKPFLVLRPSAIANLLHLQTKYFVYEEDKVPDVIDVSYCDSIHLQ